MKHFAMIHPHKEWDGTWRVQFDNGSGIVRDAGIFKTKEDALASLGLTVADHVAHIKQRLEREQLK